MPIPRINSEHSSLTFYNKKHSIEMLLCQRSHQSEYWAIITDSSAKHIFYQPFMSWQQFSLDGER